MTIHFVETRQGHAALREESALRLNGIYLGRFLFRVPRSPPEYNRVKLTTFKLQNLNDWSLDEIAGT